MKQKNNYNNLPVSKLNEIVYKTAIDRLSKVVCLDECLPGDLIAMQEQEIERYRSTIYFLEEELKKQKSEEAAQVELVAEGIIADDGLFRVGEKDILILHTKKLMRNEDIIRSQEEISMRTGIKVALFDGRSDIVGVVEHGT